MEALKSPFIFCPLPSNSSSSKKSHRKQTTFNPPSFLVSCSITPDPWTLSDGNPNYNPKSRSKNPKNPLSDDNARRIIKAKARYLSNLRKNQGSHVQTPKWIRRTPEQMINYLEDDRNGHLYGKHVVAAIKRVRSLAGKPQGSYDMRFVMGSFVAKLTFREMCVVLKEQKGWMQVRDFFDWMKLQLSYHPSVIVYTIVLRAYGQAGKIKLAEQVFLEMLESGCEPDEVACGTMLCSYARWGRHNAMLSFYSSIRERGIKLPTAVYNFMVSSLQKKSLHKSVVQVWRGMIDEKTAPDHFTYTVVLGSLLKEEGFSEEGFRVLNEMRDLGFVPEEATYCLFISFNIRTGRYNEAYELYDDMRSHGIIPSNFTCASLLALYYKTGEFNKALSLFSEMERFRIAPDEVIYGLLIRIYGKLGLYDDAQKTFEEIERLGLLTDEKTYTTMAQVHLNFGNSDKALALMEKMRSKGSILSRFAQCALLQCQIKSGDLASAEITFQALSETGPPDCSSYTSMINFYMRLNLIDKAKECILQMRRSRVEFDEELLRTVMKVYCKSGMLIDTRDLISEFSADEVFEKSTFVQTFSVAIHDSSVTLDRLDPLAFELILTLLLETESGPVVADAKIKLLVENANGLLVANQLISKFCKEGDVLKAEYLHNLLLKLGFKPEISASASLISLYGRKQKLDDAKNVFAATSACPDSNPKILYNSLIDAYTRCGKQDEAFSFYEDQIKQGNDLGPVAMSMLVNTMVNCGKYREAEAAIQNSFRANIELDTVAYNTFIYAMLKAGKLRFATRIFELMVSQHVTPSLQTYNTMISVYGRSRNLDKATEMFNLARSNGLSLDEKAYTNIICYLGKAGKTHEALCLFREMNEKGMQPGKVSQTIMLNICASAGLYAEAEHLIQTTKQAGYYSPDPTTYLALIRAYTNASKYIESEKILSSMEQDDGIPPSCQHFNAVMMAYTKAGLISEAERIYQEISRAGLTRDIECERIMLRGYLEYGLVEKGIEFFEKICEGSEEEREDRFIMSAGVHLYKFAGMEVKGEEILRSMSNLGIMFLKNLQVGDKKKT